MESSAFIFKPGSHPLTGDTQRRLLEQRQAGDSTKGGPLWAGPRGRGPVGGFSVNLALRTSGHLGAEPEGGGVAEGRREVCCAVAVRTVNNKRRGRGGAEKGCSVGRRPANTRAVPSRTVCPRVRRARSRRHGSAAAPRRAADVAGERGPEVAAGRARAVGRRGARG